MVSLSILVISFGVPIVIWYLLKPVFKDFIQIPHITQNLRKFQNDASYFDFMLSQQGMMQPFSVEIPILTIGKKEAKNVITLVTNPYCSAVVKHIGYSII